MEGLDLNSSCEYSLFYASLNFSHRGRIDDGLILSEKLISSKSDSHGGYFVKGML